MSSEKDRLRAIKYTRKHCPAGLEHWAEDIAQELWIKTTFEDRPVRYAFVDILRRFGKAERRQCQKYGDSARWDDPAYRIDGMSRLRLYRHLVPPKQFDDLPVFVGHESKDFNRYVSGRLAARIIREYWSKE